MDQCNIQLDGTCPHQPDCTNPDCPLMFCDSTPDPNCTGGSVRQLTPFPTKALAADGTWKPIDTTVDPVTLSPRNVPYSVVFLPKITTPGAVTFKSKMGDAQFYLKGWGFPGYYHVEESSDAVVDGSTITYTLSFGRIVYECLATGIKETLYIDNRNLEDPTAIGLPLGLNVEFDFDFAPVENEFPLTAIDANKQPIDVTRTSTGFAISHKDYMLRQMPIAIDPSLASVQANAGYVTSTGGTFVNANLPYYGTDSTPDTTDSKGVTLYGSWALYRAFYRIDLSAYTGHTIYGTSKLTQVINISADSGMPNAYEIPDFPPASGAPFNATNWFSLGQLPSLYTATYTPDLKNRIILAKNGITNSLKAIAFMTRSATEPQDNTISRQVGTLGPAGGGTLNFSSYGTFTQNAPSVGSASASLSWVNGGGLVSGDYHNVYYRQTGNTTWIKSGSTASYTATSYTVTGLAASTSYDFKIVDVQVVGGASYPGPYEGATSSIQTASTTSSTGPVVIGTVTVSADTRRKAAASASATTDTRRKVAKSLTITSDTRRNLFKPVTISTDTRRKLFSVVTVSADTRRKVANAITVAADTLRNLSQAIVVNISADAVRKITKQITASADTKRRTQKQISASSDTRRKVAVTATASTDTRRKVFIVSTATIDTRRRVQANLSVTADTRRRTQKQIAASSDTRRKVARQASVSVDTRRKVFIVSTVTIDTRRRVQISAAFSASTRRSLQKQISASADTRRKTTKTVTAQVDTRRKLFVLVQAVVDTRRKIARTVTVLLDTVRNVLGAGGSKKTAPYVITEIPDKYSGYEVSSDKYVSRETGDRYLHTEVADKYTLEEDF